jgi:hypothetical protein
LVVSGLVGLFAPRPIITIEAETPLRSRDILSTPFTVTNNGQLLPAGRLRFNCQVDTVATSAGQFITNARLGERVLTSNLWPGQSVSGNCAISGWSDNIVGGVGRQLAARVSIEVTYYPGIVPINQRATAGFRAERGDHDLMRWVLVEPIPIWIPTGASAGMMVSDTGHR